MSSDPESPFRAIIIGGGPVGIVAAHALHHAGIDFIVLEQHSDSCKDVGASLIVSPHNLRVFHQLDLYEHLVEIGVPLLHHSQGYTKPKRKFRRSYTLSLFQKRPLHDIQTLLPIGLKPLTSIYDGLPGSAKSRYLSGKRLADIATTSTGVEVTCTDGSSYQGSIVIGADGAHSKTRSIMRRLALQANSSLTSTWDSETPFKSTYKCLWASFRRPSEPGDSYETQGRDRSTMYLTGRDKGWIFLYEKLGQPSSERHFYDKKTLASFGDSFEDWPLTENLTVKDVLGDPSAVAGMTNLEEGIAKNVSWNGRIVLIGDAWHKFTPNSGLGFNNGIQDAVSLCNKLRALLVSHTREGKPDAAALQTAFDRYQAERSEPLRSDFARSAGATRLSTWETRREYLLGRFVYSIAFIQRFLTTRYVCPRIRKGLVLDYISTSEPFQGKIPWAFPTEKHLKAEEII